ncbi:MAG: hypothetical protein ACRETK_08345 [Steroidobacteraceae bacterium]
MTGEILDQLAPQDPRARRSRRDLQRVNRIMGARGLLIGAMRPQAERHPHNRPLRMLELGAGDGHLMLRIAQQVSGAWPPVQLTLLDRQSLVDDGTRAALGRLGWTVQTLTVDVLDWVAAPALPQGPQAPQRWDLIVTNLFLHHFDDVQLSNLLAGIAARCDAFIACEPRRSLLPLLGSHLIGALGVNAVTRHDAVLSVRAGFRGDEISSAWPADRSQWRLQEQAAGAFSQLFSACRSAASARTG